jgi:deferrochelatase/peroxidase EfeB
MHAVPPIAGGSTGRWCRRWRRRHHHRRHHLRHDRPSPSETPAAADIVPFHGMHQAGIVTPVQDRLHFAAFDLAPTATRNDLVALLRSWTAAAVSMARGTDVGPGGATNGALQKPPSDTGEAQGLPASQLTITIGFGTTLFHDADGRDRFGLAAQRPPQLADLPAFPGDTLIAVVRYSQLGFGRTSSSQQTARNLMDFKDGTNNIKSEDTAAVDRFVWVRPGDGPTG